MNDVREAVASAFEVRPLTSEDRPWVQKVLLQYWASTKQVAKGRVFQADELPGFAAWRGDEPVGVITYDIRDNECQIITHNALAGHGGIGSCLLAEVRTLARERGCSRIWLITTNDNVQAMRFYQRRGFEFVAVHRNAIAESRRLKSEIPDTGMDGVPIRHEIEMEQTL